jgi:hypothetical protein
MLKTYAYFSTLSAIYHYAYVEDNYGNTCVMYVWYGIFFMMIGAFGYGLYFSSLFDYLIRK